MEVQTRNSQGQLKYFSTLREAQDYAEQDNTVWKISFAVASGERVRLVKRDAGWVWEDIVREVEKELGVVVEPLDYGPLDTTLPLDVRGVFQYMDKFYIAGRGLVLTGVLLDGIVSPGMAVVINYALGGRPFSQRVPIKGVERRGRNRNVGLLVGKISVPIEGCSFKDAILTIKDEFPIVS